MPACQQRSVLSFSSAGWEQKHKIKYNKKNFFNQRRQNTRKIYLSHVAAASKRASIASVTSTLSFACHCISSSTAWSIHWVLTTFLQLKKTSSRQLSYLFSTLFSTNLMALSSLAQCPCFLTNLLILQYLLQKGWNKMLVIIHANHLYLLTGTDTLSTRASRIHSKISHPLNLTPQVAPYGMRHSIKKTQKMTGWWNKIKMQMKHCIKSRKLAVIHTFHCVQTFLWGKNTLEQWPVVTIHKEKRGKWNQ